MPEQKRLMARFLPDEPYIVLNGKLLGFYGPLRLVRDLVVVHEDNFHLEPDPLSFARCDMLPSPLNACQRVTCTWSQRFDVQVDRQIGRPQQVV
jgi:hypothetical protein